MKRRSLSSAFLLLLVAAAVTPAVALEEPDRLYLVGERALADGLNALAARALERFVADYPNDARTPAATMLLGRAWLGVGLHERALEVFRKAQKLSGRTQEARLWEAEALFRLKRYAEARTAFDDVLKADASAAVAADAMYGLAWTDIETRRPEAAVKRFREMLAAHPDHALAPSASLNLARTLIDMKRYADAMPILAEFPTKYPNHALVPDAQYFLGVARIRDGDAKGGVADLQAFLDENPKHEQAPAARRLVSEALGRVGSRTQLQSAYQTGVKQSTPDSLYEAANLAARLGNVRDQDAALRKLRKDFPDHALSQRAALDLANLAFKKKDWKEAATLARTAEASSDESVRAQAWLLGGETALKQERFNDAVKSFEKVQDAAALEASDRYRALAGLGLAHERLQHWRPALTAYEAVADKSPDAGLRTWAEERVKAVRARLKPADAKPKGKS